MENNLIFKCLTGSRAYGTNIETSDYDYKGVYIQQDNDILGFNYKEQINIGNDETYYEIRRFIELAQTANPTILEMMWTNSDIQHPVWNYIIENRKLFLTKKCLNSFGGYAVGQLQKAKGLNKKMNWEKEKTIRKTPIDFCFVHSDGKSISVKEWLKKQGMKECYIGLCGLDRMPGCYAIYYDWSADYGQDLNKSIAPIGYRGIAFETSNDIRLSSIPKEQQVQGILHYNKDAYSKHCKDYNEYETWLKNRNTARYVDIANHNQQIDGKNMLHCVRMLRMAEEIATQQQLNVFRPDAQYLLSIRRGEFDLHTLVSECEKQLKRLDEIYANSNLPLEVDKEFSHNLLIQIRDDYRRTTNT